MDIFDLFKKIEKTEDTKTPVTHLIVGLGNPGDNYSRTRHNAGFRAIDILGKKLGIKIDRAKYRGLYGQGSYGDQKVVLLKPQTFMNLSGEAVRGILDFYKEDIENVVIIFDDIDLEIGKIRIKERGSAGTHNGMKSIVQHLGSENFSRIKVGIGKPRENIDLVSHVLGKFPEEELKVLEGSTDNAVDATIMVIKDEISKAMNKYN
jgi:PTH1 family peptidyl-tRNA hydrolase